MSSNYIILPCSCGSRCDFYIDDNPCWGQVDVVDEYYDEESGDQYWVHACEGHRDFSIGGKYIPEESEKK